jgi:hypothetical protein
MSVEVTDEGRTTVIADTHATTGARKVGTDDLARVATHNEVHSSPASRLLADVRLLLIALWLGGAVFFSFVVAPTAFRVLPTHEQAGVLVTRTISVVNVGGFVISLLLLATAFVEDRASGRSRRARAFELASLAVVAVACGIGHWIVAARMVALRASLGRPIDLVPLDDPARVAFNSLHGYSVALMCAGIIAGVVALLVVARRRS